MHGLDIRPVGDAAVVATLGETIDLALVRRCHALAAAVQEALGVAALDVVVAYASVLVRFDPIETELAEVLAAVRGAAEQCGGTAAGGPWTGVRRSRHAWKAWKVGVCFGETHGPDLIAAASNAAMSEEQYVQTFCSAEYTVAFLGYVAGFPYLVGLPEQLAQPRLPSPRALVPAGSVGLADRQCGIYPRASPGGWRLLGHTAAPLFDVRRDPPALFASGDTIRFEPVRTIDCATAEVVG